MSNKTHIFSDPTARAFLGAQALSYSASAAVPVILSFALLDTHHSAVQVGEVLAATDLPFVLLLLVGGTIADRFSRKIVAIVSEFVRGITLIAMAVLATHPNFSVFEIGTVGAIWGIARAFFAPTLMGMTPEIFAEDALMPANSFREGARAVGNLSGPALGGVVFAVEGPAAAFGLFAALYLASALWLMRMRIVQTKELVSASFLRDLKTGFNEVRSRPWCWITIVVYSFMHLLAFGPLVVLGPVIAKAHLGGAAVWGALVASEGVGGIIGAVVASKVRLRRPVWTSSIIVMGGAPAFFLIGLASPPILIALSIVVLGFGFAFITVNWDTAMQSQFPIESLSRVSAYDIFGSVALYPFGQVLGGLATRVVSPNTAVILCGGALIALSAILLGSRSIYRLTNSPTRAS